MTRALASGPIACLVFVAALLLAAAAVQSGLIPNDFLRLWAAASTAADGDVPIGRIIAGYPTIPFLWTTLIARVTPDGAPAAAIATAALLALLAAFWFASLRRLGLGAIAAGIATLLLALHPLLLRALLGGPAELSLALFVAMLGSALFRLRARSSAAEVMAVGLTLFLLVFCHPIGAAIALAAVPFLVLAIPPRLLAGSAFNMMVALVFPTVFAVAAFTYVAWAFPGAGWTFLAAPAESLAAWSAAMAHRFGATLTGSLSVDAALTIGAALVLGAPISLVALARVRRRRALVMPGLAFAAAMIVAAGMAVATGWFGDPVAIAVAAPALAAVVLMHVPSMRDHVPAAVGLLALGWTGGAVSLALIDPSTASYLQAALHGRAANGEQGDALAAGRATSRGDGVMADTENAPAFVVGRGRARGIYERASEPFALAKLLSHLETPFVAVPDPHSVAGGSDQLNKAFPMLFQNGAPGYRLIYQNATWRVFGRLHGIAAVND